jgi:Leucine-rich repeat (LRR) protein
VSIQFYVVHVGALRPDSLNTAQLPQNKNEHAMHPVYPQHIVEFTVLEACFMGLNIFVQFRQDLCNQVATVKLDRQALRTIVAATFSRLPGVRSLHLQHNYFSVVPPLWENLPQLRVLCLSDNKLTSCGGCARFASLVTLDVSNNAIPELLPLELPRSLLFLKVRHALLPSLHVPSILRRHALASRSCL